LFDFTVLQTVFRELIAKHVLLCSVWTGKHQLITVEKRLLPR